jgi:hypothetical protein
MFCWHTKEDTSLRARSAFAALVVSIGFILLPMVASSQAMPGSPTLRVHPTELHIRENFQGAPLTISADIPKGASAVVEVKGTTHEARLLRQGRRAGLWMSVGEVRVEGAPSVYLVLSTSDLASHKDKDARWGYEALQKQIKFLGSIPHNGAGVLFEQFVKLKESEGMYGLFLGSLKPSRASNDRETIEGQLRLPSNIAPGNYSISLSVLNSGKLMEKRSANLTVAMRGLPAFLASLAYQHAVLYGLVAVIIAIVVGFVMGFVFKGKGAH